MRQQVWLAFALLGFALLLTPAAHAKGIFYAKGKILQVERTGDSVTFRFAGKISFAFATAPETDPARKLNPISWDAANVPVRIDDWTEPVKPSVRADHPDPDRTYETLVALMKTEHVIQFALDNPDFSFSNRGQLTRVTGTYIYASDAGQ